MRNQIRIGLWIILDGLFFSCKTQSPDSVTNDLRSLANSKSTPAFFEGLSAKPGSPARKMAGSILETALAPHFAKMNLKSSIESKRLERVLRFTISYLQADTVCEPSQRIKLYRGVGRQPFIGENKRKFSGFMVNNLWLGDLIKDTLKSREKAGRPLKPWKVQWEGQSGRLPQLSGDYIGKEIFESRDLLSFDVKSMDWENNLSEYSFGGITSTQSAGEASTILISTSVSASVAAEFAPSFLTLTVCPERAMLVDYFAEDFNEWEVYLPLFILPEEIALMEAVECGQIEDPDTAKKCHGKPFESNKTELNKLSSLVRNCIGNFGTEAERQFTNLVQNRFEQSIHPKFYQILTDSDSLESFRANLSQLSNICKPDCAIAKKAHEGVDRAFKLETNETKKLRFKTDYDEIDAVLKKECRQNI